jgi:hypothetical protein
MELALTIFVAGPIGFLVRRYKVALTVYLAAWVIVFPIQTVVVYAEDDGGWLYWFFNALILASGLGLNRLGSALRQRRRTLDPVRS